ncbi:uncharacterized protein LOC105382366 isoform X2 [Plutella xylostella]|uniref:uncharacterized protein LOC105382366 isoform X2 n=1 Tax=Plutella xylostella TaxID=51655 RepID=UPI002032CA7A|nr:uncharacterized protein LOC105382366 isoform X2 [Plutella xylostella]
MSIPPLVCSTPPPPDQCEDDKDTEDYDLRYNYSQDEDDDDSSEYYGNFSSFSFKNNPEENIELPKVIPKDVEISSVSPECDFVGNSNNSTKTAEIHEIFQSVDLPKHNDFQLESPKVENNVEVTNHCDNLKATEDSKDDHFQEALDSVQEDSTSDNDKSLNKEEVVEEYSHTSTSNHVDDECTEAGLHNLQDPSDDQINYNEESPEKEHEEVTATSIVNDTNIDDIGIEDLDLKFDQVSIDSGKITQEDDVEEPVCEVKDNIVFNDDPWGNEEDNSEFQATFDDFEMKTTEPKTEPVENNINSEAVADDDDFGDFDDFQSVEVKPNEAVQAPENPPSTSFQSIEIHNEAVEKVLSSIFEHDIEGTEDEIVRTLDSSLGETWRQLKEIEVRQPYMINWNSSFGQKTLLKALCIDSRNILFGPKWQHNMPKYAANLTAAPLQPQKPVTSNLSTDALAADRVTSKPDTWEDPFSSHGKESCNTETSTSSSPPRPSNLDVFDTTTSTAEQIYPSSINVQQLRQISLPDTHIFTPTDSEVPRSTTIHYDTATGVSQPEEEHSEDEYSDFQDFQATTSISKPEAGTSTQQIQEPVVAPVKPVVENNQYAINLLQPIKLEPTTPTLNWPDPGEVKTTFDDFSDFVSSAPWPSEQPDSMKSITTEVTPSTENANFTAAFSDIPDEITASEPLPAASTAQPALPTNDDIDDDDDFTTFHSAIPSVTSVSKDVDGPSPTSIQKVANEPSLDFTYPLDFNVDFSSFESSVFKTSDISDTKAAVIPEPLATNKNYIPNSFSVNAKVESHNAADTSPALPAGGRVLLPTPAPPAHSAHLAAPAPPAAAGQILQPLSLEGFSQINWPNPGSLDLQDLSRFNPVETLPSLKGEINGGMSKNSSPAHSQKSRASDDDWGDFVSSRPRAAPRRPAAAAAAAADDDEWTDFVSSPGPAAHNGVNTISFNVHTNLNVHKNTTKYKIDNKLPVDLPSLNYVTPKANQHRSYSDRHFQNL